MVDEIAHADSNGIWFIRILPVDPQNKCWLKVWRRFSVIRLVRTFFHLIGLNMVVEVTIRDEMLYRIESWEMLIAGYSITIFNKKT